MPANSTVHPWQALRLARASESTIGGFMSINKITDNLTTSAEHSDNHNQNTQEAASKNMSSRSSLYVAVALGLLTSVATQAETQTELTQGLKDEEGLSLERSQFSVSLESSSTTKGTVTPSSVESTALATGLQYKELASELKQLHQGASLSRLWNQNKQVTVGSMNSVASLNKGDAKDSNLATKASVVSDSAVKTSSANLGAVNTLDQGLLGLTREQKMATKSAENSPSVQALQSSGVFHSFNIYDANTLLLEDFDGDSFYSTFSVTFDADVDGIGYNEYANVYAELYVSQEGGPWLHYYSTEVFSIAGNSSYDDYRVLTTLQSGYQTAHYDVLIDLYEVGVSDPVATLSSNDTNALYALPLESRDRDPIYVAPHVDTYIEVEAGGALSWWELLMLASLGLLAIRKSPQR
jgi:hypothetical protein